MLALNIPGLLDEHHAKPDRYFSRLDALEAGSISILREVVAECRNASLLFSGGKDSAVLLQSGQETLERDVVRRGGAWVPLNDCQKTIRTADGSLSEARRRRSGKIRSSSTNRTVRTRFTELLYRIDVNTLERIPARTTLPINDITRVRLRLQRPIFVDGYAENRITGSFIVIDDARWFA